MATLVLTVAGGAFGGPIGAAIGGALGSAFDREILFKPKGREGPRLTELRVQTSSYGTQIAKLFGTMRVAGSVIWATELVEHRSTQGAKGQPNVTSYSYSCSFAVALSSRAVRGVGRIWAEGKLLRGADGAFKVRTGFRLHLGGEEQAADPLIASAEGSGLTPAHRGIAYAVFENMELAEFGNRIPSLTFEVIADDGAVSAGMVLETIGEGAFAAGDAGPMLGGFSAHGASLRAVAETLAAAAGGWFRSEGARLALCCGEGTATALADAGVRAEGQRGARSGWSIAAADSAPRSVTVSHYDPARDYQAGVQRAVRPGAGNREMQVELAASVDAGAAKTMAEAALARLDLARGRRTLALPWHAIDLAPGARVTIAGVAGQWRVDRWTLEAMVLSLDCVAVAPDSLPASATPGRVLGAPDRAAGQTILHAFELPPLDTVPAAVPRLAVAAAGDAPGWRRAALLLSSDGGASWTSAGATAAPAVLGTIQVPPGAAPAALEDRRNAMIVTLAHGEMVLGDADAAGLAAGANLAMAGGELLQFARAEPIGGNRWRLSGLWRGRRGTEARIGTQAAGDAFTLIGRETLALIDLPASAIGMVIRLLGEGVGDSAGAAEARAAIDGISVLPPAPVHLRATRGADGVSLVRWVRRSRTGWDWIDGADAPLGEEAERYRVVIETMGGTRIAETDAPMLMLSAGDRAGAVTVTVRQAGAHGLSPPAALILPALGDEE